MPFYIRYDDRDEGPFDLVMLLRKARNGNLKPGMMVYEDNEQPTAAKLHPKLKSFFEKDEEEVRPATNFNQPRSYNLKFLLKNAMGFAGRNQPILIATGLFLMFVLGIALLLIGLLPKSFLAAEVILISVAFHMGLSPLMLVSLRLFRGQIISPGFLIQRTVKHFGSLMIFSIIISLISILGGLLFVVPGLMILSLYFFTPFYILDQNYDFWSAMELSRKKMFKMGSNFYGVVFALVVMMFVSSLLLILPLMLMLPLALGVICSLYEETSHTG